MPTTYRSPHPGPPGKDSSTPTHLDADDVQVVRARVDRRTRGLPGCWGGEPLPELGRVCGRVRVRSGRQGEGQVACKVGEHRCPDLTGRSPAGGAMPDTLNVPTQTLTLSCGQSIRLRACDNSR
jgi:hypothetical protein